MNEPNKIVEYCDCNRETQVIECVDGLCLCQDCRNELAYSDGTVCVAWLEREQARKSSQWNPDNFTPSHSTNPIRGFGERYERRPGSRKEPRGWQW